MWCFGSVFVVPLLDLVLNELVDLFLLALALEHDGFSDRAGDELQGKY